MVESVTALPRLRPPSPAAPTKRDGSVRTGGGVPLPEGLESNVGNLDAMSVGGSGSSTPLDEGLVLPSLRRSDLGHVSTPGVAAHADDGGVEAVIPDLGWNQPIQDVPSHIRVKSDRAIRRRKIYSVSLR